MNLVCFARVIVTTCIFIPLASAIADEPPSFIPTRTTVLGTRYVVRDEFNEILLKTIRTLRTQIRVERAKGKVIGYISIPLTARGGGWRSTNVAVSAALKERLETTLGSDTFWFLPPGQIESEIPAVGGKSPNGSEYMYMWTEVLAGEGGTGSDFDYVYFAGPTDFAAHFAGTGSISDRVRKYAEQLKNDDPKFAAEVASNPDRLRQFVRYYTIRASAGFSTGAHDEWNIFCAINRKRDIGDQISGAFDGRALSPVDLEVFLRPGYEDRR